MIKYKLVCKNCNLIFDSWFASSKEFENLKKKKFFAWPNIKAKKLIIPERIGNFSPKQIANEALFLIKNQIYLKKQKKHLSKQRGKNGAVNKLSYIILNSIKKLS